MKPYLYFLFFLLQPMLMAEEKQTIKNPFPTQQSIQQTQQPPRDYGPEILSTFFYSIIPNFLQMALGAETNNPELVLNGFAGLSQGVGTVINFATKTPNNMECLRASKAFLACLKKNKTEIENSHLIKKK